MRTRWREMSWPLRAVLGFTAAGIASLVLLAVSFLWLPAIGSPSSRALQYSLTRNAGGSLLLGGGLYDCRRRPSAVWICEVPDISNSGTARYRVLMHGRRCWHARKVSPDKWEEGPPLERHVSGCVKWRDQVRLMDRV